MRSLFHDSDGWAWLGLDAPVPGVVAPCFDDDQNLVATLLSEAARRGVRSSASDIVQTSEGRDNAAYRCGAALGFEAVVYRPSLFTPATHQTSGAPLVHRFDVAAEHQP